MAEKKRRAAKSETLKKVEPEDRGKGKNKKKRNKLTKKQIKLIFTVSVLIVSILASVIYFGGESLLVLLGYGESGANEDNQPNYSILSGKSSISLSAEFDLENLLEVHFIDVGQGDAIAINFPDGKTMLIDGGTSSAGLNSIRENYLSYLYDITDNRVIEYMVVTHSDTDHYNMLTAVLEEFDVQNLFYNEDGGITYNKFLDKARQEPAIALHETDSYTQTYTIKEAGYTVTLFACGDRAFNSAENKNAQSIITLIEYGSRSILFTGDAVMATEDWFMETVDREIDVDVIKVGHHGSKTSTDTDFLEFITAEYAIISCDDGTKHGHPDAQTMMHLAYYGVATYRTNYHGNIILYIDGDGDFGFITTFDFPAENNTYNLDERKIILLE